MTTETENTVTTTKPTPAAVKKAAAPAKKAVKKAAKKAAKKVAAPAAVRATNIFTLAPKTNVLTDFGLGQRAEIAKVLKKTNGATRATLIAKLPDVPPANISWHLSMMIAAKLVKKTAQK